MISPRVAPRLTSIRSPCTCRPASTSAMFAAAPPVAARTPEMPSHSACQAPTARSCSCTRPPVRSVAKACARRAPARASVDPTGLRLCASVDDEPRPSPAGSLSSPTSVWAISTTSSAILPSAPASVARADPRAATRTRIVCQGSEGSARPSVLAMRPMTCGPCSPSAASVPAAPPSCTASRSRASSTRRCASSVPTSHVAALPPNVVGSACWSSVRATIGVARWFSASEAQAELTRATSASTSSSARRLTSIAAVSTMSWLVAP